MKALIIEDEILASRHLKQLLAEEGDMDVIDTLESIAETIEWFGRNAQPDIVFMDIHLADGIAFEIFNHVTINCPIIFTTAYDEYALRAFKVNSVDYLLKPVEASDIRAALKKLKVLSENGPVQTTLSGLMDFSERSKIIQDPLSDTSQRRQTYPVRVGDLACFFIDTGIVKALTSTIAATVLTVRWMRYARCLTRLIFSGQQSIHNIKGGRKGCRSVVQRQAFA